MENLVQQNSDSLDLVGAPFYSDIWTCIGHWNLVLHLLPKLSSLCLKIFFSSNLHTVYILSYTQSRYCVQIPGLVSCSALGIFEFYWSIWLVLFAIAIWIFIDPLKYSRFFCQKTFLCSRIFFFFKPLHALHLKSNQENWSHISGTASSSALGIFDFVDPFLWQ